MATTPTKAAAQNGFRSDLASTNQSAQLNQFVNNPAVTFIGAGQTVITSTGNQSFSWYNLDNQYDVDQGFNTTLGSFTSLGRLMIPLNPVGNGADVVVNLYADSSGNPNIDAGPIISTTITKEMINQITSPSGLADSTSPPMSTAQYNGAYLNAGFTNSAFPLPTSGTSAVGLLGGVTQSTNDVVVVGGFETSTLAAVASVNSFSYAGTGQLNQAVPQPAIPVATISPAVTIVNDSNIVVMGGQLTNTGGAYSSNVFIASWDDNTGTIGSWSKQASLPVASNNGGAAAWGNYVYYVQGATNPAVSTQQVYYAQVNNGQITTWQTAAGIPVGASLNQCFVAAINGYLIVAGGSITGAGSNSSQTFFAKINTDGSIGGWSQGPALVVQNAAVTPGANMTVLDDLLLIGGGSNVGTGNIDTIQTCSVTAEGMSDIWYQDTMAFAGSGIVAGFAIDSGVYDLFEIDVNGGTGIYNSQVQSVSWVPVPINQTLSATTTYHLVFRQVGGTASDYVQIGVTDNGGNPNYPNTQQSSTRFGNTWSTIGSGKQVPMFFNDTTMGVVGILRHTVEDSSFQQSGNVTGSYRNRWMTFVYTNAINNANLAPLLPKGFLDVTMTPALPLNVNPTFTSGVSPWTCTNGTITQSNAQTHGGFAFSGLITPTGGFSQCAAFSEQFPIPPAGNWSRSAFVPTWVMLSGWFYSPTGTTSNNFTIDIEWRDSSGAFQTFTTVANPNLVANTWTLVWGYAVAPTNSTLMDIQVAQNGSPTSSNLIYMSNVNVTTPPEYTPSITSVAQVSYSGVWPPTGITQLV